MEVVRVPVGSTVKLWVLSDLHTDYRQNLTWIKANLPSRRPEYFHVLCCAGDISNRTPVLEETFDVLTASFDLVLFTPGNHDVWVYDAVGMAKAQDSLCKHVNVIATCRKHGIRTSAVRLSVETPESDLIVVPLLSWYDSAFDQDPELPTTALFRQSPATRWQDYHATRWGELEDLEGFAFGGDRTSSTISEHFAGLNRATLEAVAGEVAALNAPVQIVSMSHFVPRAELLPEKRFLVDPHLPKVSGSSVIERQVRELGSAVHVFGHTHLPMDLTLDGVRYVNWGIGSFRERKNQTRSVSGTGFLLLYNGVDWAPPQWTYWSEYYLEHPRLPEETELAPWVHRVYTELYGIDLPPVLSQSASLPRLISEHEADEEYRSHASKAMSWRSNPAGSDMPPVAASTTASPPVLNPCDFSY